MPVELTPGLMKVALKGPVVDAVGSGYPHSLELNAYLGKVEANSADEAKWKNLSDVSSQYESLFLTGENAETAQQSGLTLISELLMKNKIDQQLLNDQMLVLDKIDSEKIQKGGLDDDEVRLAKMLASLRLALEIVSGNADTLRGIGPQVQSQLGEPGGDSHALFNTLKYSERLKKEVKLQLGQAAGIVPSGEKRDFKPEKNQTIDVVRERASKLFASLLVGGDRSDMQFVYFMKMGETTFSSLLSDWLRELPEAQGDIEKAFAAMQQQMSTDGKRAEEITRSGIKDTDFVRMLAMKFPFTVEHRDENGEIQTTTIEASAWGVVDFLYNNRHVVKKSGRAFYQLNDKGEVVGTDFVGKDKPAPTPSVGGGTVKEVGMFSKCKLWTVGAKVTLSNGETYEKGASIPFDEISNDDMRKINDGEFILYPKLPVDVFSPECRVPGSDLLTKRADVVAHGGNGAYFNYLLESNGIDIKDIINFKNPFEDLDITIGKAGDISADWLDQLAGFEDSPDKQKTLVIRNLYAGLAPIFSIGRTMAQVMGNESFWNPSYDGSRVMRIMENTIMADAYDEQKGITPFGFREMWLTKTYGDYLSRMFPKAHPIMKAWDGKEVLGNPSPFDDRGDPWGIGDLHGAHIELKKIKTDSITPGLADDKAKLARMWRERAFGAKSFDQKALDKLDEAVKNKENNLKTVRSVDEFIFGERAFQPGDWEERKVLNYVYANAKKMVFDGEKPQEALKWAKEKMDSFQVSVLMHSKARRGNLVVTRDTASIVATSVGLPREMKQKISQRPLYDTIYGLAESREEKEYYAKMGGERGEKTEMFKGIMGAMVFASEEFSLKQFDYASTEREIEAWLRYLCSNAEAYKVARSNVQAAVQTQIDPAKLQEAYLKFMSPDDLKGAGTKKVASFLADAAKDLDLLPDFLQDVEANELYKALSSFPEFITAHADLNWQQKRELYISYVYLMEGYLDSGVEYALRSSEAEAKKRIIDPGDKHVPLTLNPVDGKKVGYTPEEIELDKGLLELFRGEGWRVEFNEATGNEGRILLNGGGMAHAIQGSVGEDDLWKTDSLHKKGEESRPVDVFGMAKFASHVIGYQLMKMGTNAEIVTAKDLEDFEQQADAWYAGKDKNSVLIKR